MALRALSLAAELILPKFKVQATPRQKHLKCAAFFFVANFVPTKYRKMVCAETRASLREMSLMVTLMVVLAEDTAERSHEPGTK